MEQKNGVLELPKLEYYQKWYLPIYFPNSVSGLNISKINANGPKSPKIQVQLLRQEAMQAIEEVKLEPFRPLSKNNKINAIHYLAILDQWARFTK